MSKVIVIWLVFLGPCALGADLLSFYLGVGALPDGTFVEDFCGDQTGKSAAPLNISERVVPGSVNTRGAAIDPQIFQVLTTQGKTVTPTCATLEPAYGVKKNMTILLVGDFANQGLTPASVQVVGDLWTMDGTNVRSKAVSATIPTPMVGVRLVQARLQLASSVPDKGGCPLGTTHIVMLVFQGGVKGFAGAPLGESQRAGTFLQYPTVVNGKNVLKEVNPNALAGDFDNDNYVNGCFTLPGLNTSLAMQARVQSNIYFDPGNRPNPASSVSIRLE